MQNSDSTQEPQPSAWLKQALIAIAIIIVAVVLGKAMLGLKKSPDQKPQQKPLPALLVQTVVAEPQRIPLQVQAVLESARKVNLVAEVSGRVQSVSEQFRRGAFLENNADLLTIDPTDYQLALAQARAGLLNAELNYNDKRARYQAGSLSLKQAEAELYAGRERVKQAERDLSNTTVKTPFAAVVLNRQVELGAYVQKGTVLAELADSELAELRIPLRKKDLVLLAAQPFSDSFADVAATLRYQLGGKTYQRQAHIKRLEAQVDNNTRTFYAVAELPKPYGVLNTPEAAAVPLGSFVDVFLQSRLLNNLVVLPVTVLHKPGKLFVVSDDATLTEVSASVFYEQGDSVWLHLETNDNDIAKDEDEGILKAGDQVVLNPLPSLYAGMQVEVHIAADKNKQQGSKP